MIALYRYVKRKRAEKQAAASAHEQGEGAVEDHNAKVAREAPPTIENKSSESSSWRWRITLAVALAIPVYLETLDYTVVATAQTHIASAFDRLDLQSWIGTAYLLTSTVFLPFFASLADIYGRHFAVQLALLLFIFGSALSTGAKSMEMMIGGRAVAGIGAAGMLTAVRTIMADSSSLEDNNWQTTMLFLLYTIGYCTGPVIGGALVTVSFRWIFAINLPTSALAMVLIFILLRGKVKKGFPSERIPIEYRREETYVSKLARIDWIGTTFFVGAGILVLLALNFGSNQGWSSATVIVGFAVGGVLFILCIGWEYILDRQLKNPSTLSILWADPMIPLDVMSSYDIAATMFGAFVGGMVMFVMFYFVAIYFIVVTGLSPTKAGSQLIYFAPGMGGGALLGLQLTKRTKQAKPSIILGSAVLPVSLGLVSMAIQNDKQSQVNGFMAMAGAGVGLTIGSLLIHARFSLPSNRAAITAALNLFFRSFGGTVGLAQCGAVLNGRVRSIITSAIISGALSASDASNFLNSDGPNSLDGISQLSPDGQAIVKQAFREGSRWAFISLIPWAGLAFISLLFLKNIKTNPVQEEDRNEKLTIENEKQTGV